MSDDRLCQHFCVFENSMAEEAHQEINDQTACRTPEQWDDSGALQMQISCVAQQTQSLLAVQTRSEVHMQVLQTHIDLVAQQVQLTEQSSEQLSGKIEDKLLQIEEKQQKLEKTLGSLEQRQRGMMNHIRLAWVESWHPCETMRAAAKTLLGLLPRRASTDLRKFPSESTGTPQKSSCAEEAKKKAAKRSMTRTDDELGDGSPGLVDVGAGTSVSRLSGFVLLGSLIVVSLLSASIWMFPRGDQGLVDESVGQSASHHHDSTHSPVVSGPSLRRSVADVTQVDSSATPVSSKGSSLATIDATGLVQPDATPSEKTQQELITPFLKEIGFSSLNAKDDQGVTVLHTAIHLGRTAVAMALLKAKAFKNLNSKDSQGWTALHEAAIFGSTSVGTALLDMPEFTRVNAQDKSARTALHLAAMKGHVDVLELLLKHGPFTYVNEKDKAGRTALHYAAYFGHTTSVRALMNSSRFTELNAEDEKGATVLHYAAIAGYYDIAIAVMSDPRFVKVNAKSHADRTALNHAARYGHMSIVKAILKHPEFTELNGKDKQGYSVLHRAASHGHADVVDALLRLDKFVEVHTKDDEGWTALHHAANGGHMDVVTVLLQSKRFTDISAKDKHGKSALHLADERKHFIIASALRQRLLGKEWVAQPASRQSETPGEDAI